MSRTLVWSQAALDDFDQAIAYLAARSPQAARRIAAAIDLTALAIAEAHTGRPGRMENIFEKNRPENALRARLHHAGRQ